MSLVRTLMRLCAVAILIFAVQIQAGRFDYGSFGEAQAAANSMSQFVDKPDAAEFGQLWQEWKATYGKSYGGSEDAAAAKIFKDNLKTVIRANMDPQNNGSYWLAPNQFADLSFDAFAKKYLMPEVDTGAGAKSGRKLLAPGGGGGGGAAKPTGNKDFTASGLVTPVRNQGQCGSCWAFAGVGAAESATLLASGQTVAGTNIHISEQEMVDCVSGALGFSSQGCNGGYSTDVFRFMSTYNGTGDATYGGYTSGSSGSGYACNSARAFALSAPVAKLTSQGRSLSNSATNMRDTLFTRGPSVIYYYVNNNFQLYKGGILPSSACSTKQRSINHAMLLTGYNGDTTTPYWSIKNSWGTGWGEQGYIRVQATADGTYGTCAMYYNGAMYAVAGGVTNSIPV